MRLTDQEIQMIKKLALRHFGKGTHIYLFGSRIDDHLKGGDIDLLVSAADNKMTFKNKIVFLVDLKKQLGEQKIDVVFDRENKSNQFFLQSIKQKSIQLC